jgi:hypothetical protein
MLCNQYLTLFHIFLLAVSFFLALALVSFRLDLLDGMTNGLQIVNELIGGKTALANTKLQNAIDSAPICNDGGLLLEHS